MAPSAVRSFAFTCRLQKQAVTASMCNASNIEMWWQDQGINCIFVWPIGAHVF